MNQNFELLDTKRMKELKDFGEIFKKKRFLERKIADLIREFEEEAGLAVDLVKYQRDLTLPIKANHYITLTVKLSQEELEKW